MTGVVKVETMLKREASMRTKEDATARVDAIGRVVIAVFSVVAIATIVFLGWRTDRLHDEREISRLRRENASLQQDLDRQVSRTIEEIGRHMDDPDLVVSADPTDAFPVGDRPAIFATGAVRGCAQAWQETRGPGRLLDLDVMLYPQYEDSFTTISAEWFAKLQDKARTSLRETPYAHPDVIAHWQSIVDGRVPFGWKIKPKR